MRMLLKNIRLKWVAYALELVIVYILQNTPGLIPEFLGVQPVLLVIFAVSIAMFEGEGPGLWFGLAAGALMDITAPTVFGFNALMLMLICYACGMLVVYLMRNNLVSSLCLGAGAVLIMGLITWFIQYVILGNSGVWFYIYGVLLPRLIYTTALMPLAFFFNRAIATHLADED